MASTADPQQAGQQAEAELGSSSQVPAELQPAEPAEPAPAAASVEAAQPAGDMSQGTSASAGSAAAEASQLDAPAASAPASQRAAAATLPPSQPPAAAAPAPARHTGSSLPPSPAAQLLFHSHATPVPAARAPGYGPASAGVSVPVQVPVGVPFTLQFRLAGPPGSGSAPGQPMSVPLNVPFVIRGPSQPGGAATFVHVHGQMGQPAAAPSATPAAAPAPAPAPAPPPRPASPPPPPPPEVAMSLEPPALRGGFTTAVSLQLHWDVVPYACGGYVVEQRGEETAEAESAEAAATEDEERAGVQVYSGNDTTLVVDKLQPNRKYSFRIRAIGGRTEERAHAATAGTGAAASSASTGGTKKKGAKKGSTSTSSSSAYSLQLGPSSIRRVVLASHSAFSPWFSFATSALEAPELSLVNKSKNTLKVSWTRVEGAQSTRVYFVPAAMVAEWTPEQEVARSRGRHGEETVLQLADVELQQAATSASGHSSGGSLLLFSSDSSASASASASSACSYTQRSLRPGQSYHFFTRSMGPSDDGSDDSLPGPLTSFTTAPGVPNPPVDLRRVRGSPSGMEVAWKNGGGNGAEVQDYTLQMSEHVLAAAGAAAASSSVKDSWSIVYHGPLTSHALSNLAGGVVYKFRVKAANLVGASAFTPPLVCGTERAPPDPPSVPMLVKGGRKSRSLRVEWEPPMQLNGAQLEGYVLQVSSCRQAADFDTHPDLIRSIPAPSAHATVPALQPGGAYFLRVVALSDLGSSAPSAPVVRMDSGAEVPGEPGRPRVEGQGARGRGKKGGVHAGAEATAAAAETNATPVLVSPSKLALSWAPSAPHGSPVISYSLLMSKLIPVSDGVAALKKMHLDEAAAAAASWTEVARFPTPSVAVPPALLRPHCFAAFRVQAHNALGSSERGDLLLVQTEAGVPSAPAAPLRVVGRVGSSGAQVRWEAPAAGSPLLNGDELKAFVIEVHTERPAVGGAGGKGKHASTLAQLSVVEVPLEEALVSPTHAPATAASTAAVSARACSFTLSSLPPFTSLHLRYALLGRRSGKSPYSPFVRVHTAPPAPAAPSFLPVPDAKRRSDQLGLQWECAVPAAHLAFWKQPLTYVLEGRCATMEDASAMMGQSSLPAPRGSTLGPSWRELYRGPSCAFIALSLLADTLYSFRVRALLAAAPAGSGSGSGSSGDEGPAAVAGEWSAPTLVRTRKERPGPPTNLSVVTTSYGAIRLRFAPPEALLRAQQDAESLAAAAALHAAVDESAGNQPMQSASAPAPLRYRIEYRRSDGGGGRSGGGGADSWSLGFDGPLDAVGSGAGPSPLTRQKNLRGLAPATTYELRVSVANEEGMGQWSDVLRASTTGLPPPPPTKPMVLPRKEAYQAFAALRQREQAGEPCSDAAAAPSAAPIPVLVSWSFGAYEAGSVEAAQYVLDPSAPLRYVLSQRVGGGDAPFVPVYSGPVPSASLLLSPSEAYSFQVTVAYASDSASSGSGSGTSKPSVKSARWSFETWAREQQGGVGEVPAASSVAPSSAAATASAAAATAQAKERAQAKAKAKAAVAAAARAEEEAQTKLVATAATAAAASTATVDAADDSAAAPARPRPRKRRGAKGGKGGKGKGKGASSRSADVSEEEDEEEDDEGEDAAASVSVRRPIPAPSVPSAPLLILTPAETARKKREAKRRYSLFLAILLTILCVALAIGVLLYVRANRKHAAHTQTAAYVRGK